MKIISAVITGEVGKVSPNELLGYHLPYEIWMLRETCNKFPTSDIIINNALIESFCIHARNLFEFFRKEASNYTEEGYLPFPAVSTGKLHRIAQRINVQISHLIYEGRTAKDSEKIDSIERAEILALIDEEATQFWRHLARRFGVVSTSFNETASTTTTSSSITYSIPKIGG